MKLTKRLIPLYIAAFLQSFVLWYTVEKLFMHTIGFNDAGIGFMVALYSIIMLAVEVPSGILADKWSRKGVLIIASVGLAACSLIGALSQNPLEYLICAMIWGVFFACYSGLYDSIIYDTVYEETKNSKQFENFYGKYRAIDSVGLVTSSVAGGVLANIFDARITYFLTIPVALVSIIPLLKFREPTLHKSEVHESFKIQVSLTLQAIFKNRAILPTLIALTTVYVLSYMLYEFNQLWLIALATPAALFGIANAALLASNGMGGVISGKLASNKYAFLCVIAAFICSAFALIFIKNLFLVVTAQVIFGVSLVGITVLLKRVLHDNLTAKIRAGASSAVGSLSRLVLIPLALLFGWLSNAFSVFVAATIFLPLVVIVTTIVIAQNVNLLKYNQKG